MNNPTNQAVVPPTQAAKQARLAFRIAAVTAVLMAVACVYNIYTALQNQDYLSVAITAIISIVAAVAAWLSRRGRANLGIVLFISIFCGLMALAPLSVAGMGLLFATMVIVLSTGIALATLPPSLAGKLIVLSFGVGFLIVLVDLFGPAGRPTPSNPIASTVVIMGLVIIYGLIMARQFTSFSLRTKLIIAFVATGMLAAGIIAFATNYLTRQTLINNANQALLAAARQTATSLDVFTSEALDTVRTQAQLPTLVEYLSLPPDQRSGSAVETEATQLLHAFSQKDQVFISSYALLDQQGLDVIDTYPLDIGLDKSERDYFAIPLQTGLPYISPARLSDTTREFAFYTSSPVRNSAGEIIGLLRVRYNAAILQQLISQSNGLAGPESFPILLDEHHIRLADGEAPDNILKSVVPLEPALVAELQAEGRLPAGTPTELATNLPSFEQGMLNVNSEPYFSGEVGEEEGEADEDASVDLEQAAVVSLKSQPWFLVFAQPQEISLASVRNQTRATVLLATFITLVVALVALGVGQFLARPIVRLTDVAQRVTAGDLEARAAVESQDEIGQLAAAFNQMTAQLRHFIGTLEEQVRDRTAELSLSVQVGQRSATIRDLDTLLPTIIEFIRDRFALYYVHVYFVDDVHQKLVIKAGTGVVGEELMARQHSLPVGPGSIVGQVAATGQAIVVPDTQTSPVFKPNPLLPETRSELAVPLIVEGQVMGVLDMQSDRVNTFTEQNLTVFEAMAAQLSSSIDSAQQWSSAREAQQKMEDALRQLTREAWAERLNQNKQGVLGYAYNLATVRQLDQLEVGSEVEASHATLETKVADGGAVVPVKVQDRAIGQLTVTLPHGKQLSPDEQALLEVVTEQLAQTAENLRLFGETQAQADGERTLREIAEKMRSATSLERLIKIATEELGQRLSAEYARIDMGMEAQPIPAEIREQNRQK